MGLKIELNLNFEGAAVAKPLPTGRRAVPRSPHEAAIWSRAAKWDHFAQK